MKKIIKTLPVILLSSALLVGCASTQRACVDLQSDLAGGLERTIVVYTADGEMLAEYKGKIDIESNAGGYVKFDFNGKRYIYYNCFIETIADI